jgi:hypothetical protein
MQSFSRKAVFIGPSGINRIIEELKSSNVFTMTSAEWITADDYTIATYKVRIPLGKSLANMQIGDGTVIHVHATNEGRRNFLRIMIKKLKQA